MFYNANFNNDISKWNTSKVKDMDEMFMASHFNNDISNWDVSNVEYMCKMFANSVFNTDISMLRALIKAKNELIEEREKNGVKKIRDLKVNVVSYEKKYENKIEISLSSISPNAFIRIANIDQKFIKIKRIKYCNC
jgi:surface protein